MGQHQFGALPARERSYDEYYPDGVCANCAVPDTNSNISQGRAILMMNGDEDYDDDFVMENL
ncbi:hypothetical protein AB0K51_34240 [Kitasatospora sp. NPDC049285]|uniref:hypothetical protein n=1 Tax=Kitasatospora sp. NPDC049285 TaxID=3157096 RepID=UPI00342A275A